MSPKQKPKKRAPQTANRVSSPGESTGRSGRPVLPANDALRRHGRILLGLYLFVAIYLVPVFPHGGSANEQTRWATAASIMEKGKFELSWILPLVGPIVDTAKVGDRIYSNKAPAVAILAVPAYAAGRLLSGPPEVSNIRITWTLMRWLVSTAPLFLLALYWERKSAPPLFLAVLLFGTPLFLYSLLLFSHVLAAVALYFAYRVLYSETREASIRNCILAGLLSGLAVTSEFPAVIPVAVFGAGLLLRKNPVRSRLTEALAFVLGGLPFAAGLLIYNKATFGSFFSLSYEHEAFAEWAEVAGRGFLGISWPTPNNFWLLLFSPSRGLFFYSPILLLAAFRLFHWNGASAFRKKVRAAAVAAAVLVMCGHGAAHGGWAAGPRYLVMILPLLLEPMADTEAEGLHPIGTGLLFGLSFFLCVMPALTFPFAPPEYSFPHNTFFRPFLISDGWLTPALGALLGMGAGWITAMPVLLALLAGLILPAAGPGRSTAMALGIGIGAIGFSVYVLAPGLDRPDLQLRRASIAERFFRPGGRLEPFLSSAQSAGDLQTVRLIHSMEWMVADTRANAPDGWPYSSEPAPSPGPTARQKEIVVRRQNGDIAGAVLESQKALQDFPSLRCSLTSNLAVLLYTSGRKDQALSELESVRSLADRGATQDCARNLFLLGSLYRELGRSADAASAFREYLTSSDGLQDDATQSERRAAAAFLQPSTR